MATINDVRKAVRHLLDCDAIHIKRGFRISDTNLFTVTNHLLEEAVEFQAALTMSKDADHALDEAADLLMIFTHALAQAGISFDAVCERAESKLLTHWTIDPSKVTAVQPGLTRKSRADQ